jgi:hypothetical protein
MKNWIFTISSAATFCLLSTSAYAPAPAVPEINGGGAALALGLTVGVIALIREHRGSK